MSGIEWTDADLQALKAAVASGVLQVTYDGPPRRSITYQSLSEMRALLAEMNRQVTSAPTHRYAKFRRGFRDNDDE